jgi:flagellin-specific chaperone FliS
MTEDVGEVRKLMMLISDLRSKDTERYEQHVSFMNEVVTFIKKISDNMNENWKKINGSLQKLNQTIETSLDTLLTGINPEGIRETSNSLKDIMDTMGKSMTSMNLENVMRELQALTGKGVVTMSPGATGPQAINTQFGSPYTSNVQPVVDNTKPQANDQEIFGYVPDSMKKKKTTKEEPHLMRPSDLFKS